MGNCFAKKSIKQKYQINNIQEIKNIKIEIIEPLVLQCKKQLGIDKIIISEKIYSYQKIIHPSFEQIDKDIGRTFPLIANFNQQQTQIKFKNLLRRIALYYPKLGYTQGINFLAGFLMIKGLNEVESLQTVISLTSHPNILLIGLYEDYFPLCRLYCQIFWIMLKRVERQLYEKIKSINIPDEIWIFQWFISFFISSLPLQYIQSIFLYLIRNKFLSFVKIALGIVLSLKQLFEEFTNFQDQFLIALGNIKDYQFSCINLTIQAIQQNAERINDQLIIRCLKETTCTNWYKEYFILSNDDKKCQYQQFIKQKQNQRNIYLQLNKNGTSQQSNYSRLYESVQILDVIEERKQKIMMEVYSRSLGQKPYINSAIKLSAKRHSLRAPPQDQFQNSITRQKFK